MKKVELLAPAGNYESFLAAIHAGADAVYLGGNRFGARAYAGNLTEEEICRAIHYAHIYGKKVYLTVNTLVKEKEFQDVYEYLLPLYRAGLDAAIIQDMGVFYAVGQWFPGLERHISTQMTITGVYGASLMEEAGAVRIVPARELSLEEIKEIKKRTNIEIEAFVHGAVCYCYSGQCLFSSLLGGRSGNRGRCAQPCRLPYEVTLEEEKTKKGEYYPLSLKDMCTITMLPALIEAGIDSFKIEGRMKSPEYTAGVTAIYRKYIDQYYKDKRMPFHVSKADMDKLSGLYLRSSVSTGYYERHNGKEMLTLQNPGYAPRSEALTAKLKETFLQGDYRLPVIGRAFLEKGRPCRLEITFKELTVSVSGRVAETALKQPLTEENVKKQLNKSGNSFFSFDKLTVSMDADVFLPVKELNELRRMAFEQLEQRILKENGLNYKERKEGNKAIVCKQTAVTEKAGGFTTLVHTKDQLLSAVSCHISKIYLSVGLLSDKDSAAGLWDTIKNIAGETSFYLALPYIIRKRDKGFLEFAVQLLEMPWLSGVLVRNLEEIAWLKEIGYTKAVDTDAGLYLFNRCSCLNYGLHTDERTLPFELNGAEIRELTGNMPLGRFAQIIYGRIPLMITANCVAKTMDCCKEKNLGFYGRLTDRYRKTFPVYMNCRHCYNVIYNSVPLSLHQNMERLKKENIHSFRMDFTMETGEETEKIIRFYKENRGPVPIKEYTNGHFKRGVE